MVAVIVVVAAAAVIVVAVTTTDVAAIVFAVVATAVAGTAVSIAFLFLLPSLVQMFYNVVIFDAQNENSGRWVMTGFASGSGGSPGSPSGFASDNSCKENNASFVWCLPPDYNQEKHPFICTKRKHRFPQKSQINFEFISDSHLINKSLPWNYDFKFVVEEISNVNDKAQVGIFCPSNSPRFPMTKSSKKCSQGDKFRATKGPSPPPPSHPR